MKTIIHRIYITLIVSVAFVAQLACGATNSIDFSGFYQEWQVSPSNALEQITPPLMELAASAKTNAADQAVLHNSLLHLFSTNTLYGDDVYLPKMKQKLFVDTFRASETYSTPQEEEIISLAKTLAFLRNASIIGSLFPIEHTDQDAYNATARKLIENKDSSKFILPRGFSETGMELPHTPTLIMPSGLETEEAWASYRRFRSIQHELYNMNRSVFDELSRVTWIGLEEAQQEERDHFFVAIVALKILAPDEERRIAKNLKVDPATLQAQPNPTE